MPLTRSQSRRPKPTAAVVDLGDGDGLNIVFDRNAVTPAWIAETDRQAREQKDVFALAAGLAEVLESWDLVEDDGATPVPISRDEIGGLSFAAVNALVGAVIEAASPSRAEGNASSERSSMEPSASEGQNGMSPGGAATSPLPTVSASPSPT